MFLPLSVYLFHWHGKLSQNYSKCYCFHLMCVCLCVCIRGVRLAKNDFGSVFGSVLQKNCGFRFGFGFTKLTAVSVFETTWKTVPKPPKSVFENRTAETEFSVFEFWGRFGSVRFLENWYPKFSSDSAHRYSKSYERILKKFLEGWGVAN